MHNATGVHCLALISRSTNRSRCLARCNYQVQLNQPVTVRFTRPMSEAISDIDYIQWVLDSTGSSYYKTTIESFEPHGVLTTNTPNTEGFFHLEYRAHIENSKDSVCLAKSETIEVCPHGDARTKLTVVTPTIGAGGQYCEV
jgi:hypothetical protein